MGFNRKSDAGPFEGIPGQIRYQSDVLFGYFPVLIPALDYQLFGCNAIFSDPSFKIHEAYGVNTTIEQSIVGQAETLEFQKDSIGDYDVAYGGLGSEMVYAMLTVSQYWHGSNTGNELVDQFEIPDTTEIISGGTNDIYFPNLPILVPWKSLRTITGDFQTMVAHQVQIPILYTEATANINQTKIPLSTGTEVNMIRSSQNARLNTSILGQSVYGINAAYSLGETTAEFTSSVKWHTPNDDAPNNIRGVSIDITEDADSLVLTIVAGRKQATGMSIVKVPANSGTKELSWTSDYTGENNCQWAYGFAYIPVVADLITEIEDKYFSGDITGKNINTAAKLAASYLLYILETHDSETTKSCMSFGDSSIHGTRDHKTYAEYAAWLSGLSCSVSVSTTMNTPVGKYTLSASASQIIRLFTYMSQAGFSNFIVPTYTTDCSATWRTVDLKEIGEGGKYGLVYAEFKAPLQGPDHTNQSPLYHASQALGFDTLEMKFEDTISATINYGHWSSDWSMTGASDNAWKIFTIAASSGLISSATITQYKAYQLPSIVSTEITDLMLLPDKFMTIVECGYVTANPTYSLNNIVTGVADDFESSIAYKSTSGVAMINQTLQPSNDFALAIDNLSALTYDILDPIIYSIISLNDKFDLTYVRYNNTSYQGYLGILDVETLRHYTPVNVFNSNDMDYTEQYMFDAMPTIEEVKVLKANNVSVEVLVKATTSAGNTKVYYLTLMQVKAYAGAIFITDTVHKEAFVLESYYIDPENNQLNYKDVELDNLGTNLGVMLYNNAGVVKNVQSVEYDSNIVLYNTRRHSLRLNISSILSMPSYNLLGNAFFNIVDISNFASNAVKIPMLYPFEGLSITSDNIGNEAYAAITSDLDDDFIINLSYYGSRLLNYNPDLTNTLGGRSRSLYAGAIMVGTLPGIDKNVNNYSVLPEKTTTILRIGDIRHLTYHGTNYFPANDKGYVVIQKEMYASSSINLIKSTNYGLFTLSGEIFGNGNIFCVTDARQTYLYTISENSIPTFLKTIDGVVLCDPVSIGDDIIIICNNAINSFKYGTLYNFDNIITNAIVKPVTGNGYLLYTYSNDLTEDVALVCANGDVPTAANGEVLYFDGLANNFNIYHLNDKKHIIKLDFDSTLLSPTEMNVIKNNCYGNTLTVYTDNPDPTSYTYKPCAYGMFESGAYHTNSYIISEPVQLRNQKAEIAIADTVFIYSSGYGTIRFELLDGKNTIVDKTITVGSDDTDEYEESRIELGMIPYDNLYYKITINPTLSNCLKIQTVKIRLNYLQEP